MITFIDPKKQEELENTLADTVVQVQVLQKDNRDLLRKVYELERRLRDVHGEIESIKDSTRHRSYPQDYIRDLGMGPVSIASRRSTEWPTSTYGAIPMDTFDPWDTSAFTAPRNLTEGTIAERLNTELVEMLSNSSSYITPGIRGTSGTRVVDDEF